VPDLVEAIESTGSPEWLNTIVDTAIDTFNSVPLEDRVTFGMILVAVLVSSKWLLPALGKFIRDVRGK